MPSPGKLDQRVTLQGVTLSDDGAGGKVKTWADFATTPTVWCHVKPSAGGERFDEDRTTAMATLIFTIRYRSDVDETDRLVWNGEIYNIRQRKRASNRKPYLVLVAERGVST